MKRILILTASFGEGHNAAARNLKEGFMHHGEGDVEVRVEDIFRNAYGWLDVLSEKVYLGVINHLPSVWQWFFDVLHDTNFLKKQAPLLGPAKRELQRLIKEFKPDWILSTYPGCNYLLSILYPQPEIRPFRHATIVTDSITINKVWHQCFTDFYFVPNRDSAEILEERGIDKERIIDFGFPVPPEFAELKTNRQYPPETGVWKILYVINAAHRTATPLVERLLQISGIQLTVTYGKDEALGRTLKTCAKKLGKEISLYGWTPEMPRLMKENHVIISKAGGATVQECLAACSPMIASQIVPGQEVGNGILLERYNAGLIAETPEKIIAAIEDAMAHQGAPFKAWHEGAKVLSRPRASLDIAKFLLDQK
ncbi:MAG: glycosyltransferase [Chthoniobacterales bacterium]